MSLELKIEKLTDAIQHLIIVLEGLKLPPVDIAKADPAPTTTPKAKAEPKAKEEPTPEPVKVDREAIKQSMLDLLRNDRANKPKIAAILESFGVKRLDEVPEAALADFKNHIDGVGK